MWKQCGESNALLGHSTESELNYRVIVLASWLGRQVTVSTLTTAPEASEVLCPDAHLL